MEDKNDLLRLSLIDFFNELLSLHFHPKGLLYIIIYNFQFD